MHVKNRPHTNDVIASYYLCPGVSTSSSLIIPFYPGMNTLYRPLLRSVVFRGSPRMFQRTIPLARPVIVNVNSTLLHARTVASSVSGKPGSQTLEHAATNVKEELGNSAADLAKVIAGANLTQDSVVHTGTESFVSRRDMYIIQSSLMTRP